MIKTKIDVYNHIVSTLRPEQGTEVLDMDLFDVLNIIKDDFDLIDGLSQEIFCIKHALVLTKDIEGTFLLTFTCGDGFMGDLKALFDRFEFVSVKD